MPLKAIIDDIDSVDEPLREYYRESEGVFVLDLEGVEKHPSTAPLQNAMRNAKQERDQAKAEIGTLRGKLSELESKPNPTAKDEAEKSRLREQIEAEKQALADRVSQLESENFQLKVDGKLDGLLREVGITEPAYVRSAKRDIVEKVKLVDGKPMVDIPDLGMFEPSEYVRRYANGEGAAFVSKPQGSGARGQERGASKSMTRSDFEALDQDKRMAAIREGVAITD